MFHVEKRLYFERLPEGKVRIYKLDSQERLIFEQVLDENSWASVISSMSAGGEEDLRYFSALDFHHSKGYIKVVSIKWDDNVQGFLPTQPVNWNNGTG